MCSTHADDASNDMFVQRICFVKKYFFKINFTILFNIPKDLGQKFQKSFFDFLCYFVFCVICSM